MSVVGLGEEFVRLLALRFRLMQGEREKGWPSDRRRREIKPAGLVNSPFLSSGGGPERDVARLREKSNLRDKKLDPWRGGQRGAKSTGCPPD